LTDTSGLLHPATVPAININGTQTSTPSPIINGTGKVGTQLTATIGTWDSAVTTSYEWLSANTVLGENGPLTLLPSYVGSSITLAVTGTKLHVDPVTTSASLTVLAGDLVTKTPTISGTAQVGDTLTATVAAWGPGTVFLSYQWYANGQAIAGANSRRLTLAGLQAGTKITVAVTGAEFGYATAAVSSAPTGVVTPGVLVVGTPTTSGTFQVGKTVTANPGNWSAGTEIVTFTYQWWANGARIVNATTATLTLTKNELGKKISVQIAGSALGYTSATKTSGQSSPVKP
jgi:hypothetical protein